MHGNGMPLIELRPEPLARLSAGVAHLVHEYHVGLHLEDHTVFQPGQRCLAIWSFADLMAKRIG
jgi:hypothetical protein